MQLDPFTKFEKDWALLTAGSPDRYTWQFLKDSDAFTVAFFPERCRKALTLMGTLSGRDGDKVAAAGLTPKFLPEGITFEEASETFVCKKIYMAPMAYEDVPPEARRIYQNGVEPHWIIMGEVVERLS